MGQINRYIEWQSEKQAKEQLVSDADSTRPSEDYLCRCKRYFSIRDDLFGKGRNTNSIFDAIMMIFLETIENALTKLVSLCFM